MTRKSRRMVFMLVSLAALRAAAALVLTALDKNMLFFYAPGQVITDWANGTLESGKRFKE